MRYKIVRDDSSITELPIALVMLDYPLKGVAIKNIDLDEASLKVLYELQKDGECVILDDQDGYQIIEEVLTDWIHGLIRETTND